MHNFLSYLADTQTNRQTNKNWQKHYLLGGGNYSLTDTLSRQLAVKYYCCCYCCCSYHSHSYYMLLVCTC